ncbi:MAG TPA: hypothetical protein ENH40_05175, partial [Nitrospirae bacterium]|nr:hypothetical protein [Nitrospirota bacterium]
MVRSNCKALKLRSRLFVMLALFVAGLMWSTHAYAADRYWVGAGAGDPEDWDDNANWSDASGGAGGFSYPIAGDTATFNGAGANGNKNITLDAAVTVDAITNTGGYTGTFTTSNNTITLSGSFQFDGGILTAGSSTITVGGNWDTTSIGTFTPGTSNVRMTAAGAASLNTKNWQAFYDLTIVSGTITAGGPPRFIVDNDLTVQDNATFIINNSFSYVNNNLILGGSNSTLTLNSNFFYSGGNNIST